MADKEILAQIRELEQRRPTALLDALGPTYSEDGAPDLADALDALQHSFANAAELYERAKVKGAKSLYIDPLRHAAAEVGKVAAALRQPRTETYSTTDITGPRSRQRQCADVTPHERHENGVGPVTGDTLYCLGVEPPRDLGSLDALIADSVAEGRGSLRDQPQANADAWLSGGDDVTAYLSGAADTLPGLAEALVPGSVRDATATAPGAVAVLDRPAPPPAPVFDLGPIDDDTSVIVVDDLGNAELITSTMPTTWESESMTPDGHRPPGLVATLPPVPLLGQPGNGGAGYDPSYIPPGGVPFTFAELLTPVPYASLPPHLSHSQMDTIGECPAKYRMQRLPRLGADNPTGMAETPEIPQWALIGGNAFHAAVEMLERRWAQNPDAVPPRDDEHEMLWRAYFDAEIAKVEQSSPVPRSLWRASKRGAEGETWWNANGPEMLRKYLAARPAEPTMTGVSGAACIEAELQVIVPTAYGPLPFKAIIDRATVTPDGTVTIRDYKTGDRMPDSADQLAEQAWTLALHSGFTPDRIIPGGVFGTYYNARKGTWTAPIDLFAEYGYEWFAYRITAAHAQRLALTTGPTPARKTSFCGGCSVKWACPIGGPKR